MSQLDLSALGITSAEQSLLSRFGFDAAAFAALREDLRRGAFPPERNQVTGPVAPPARDELVAWPTAGSAEALEAERVGRQALDRGQVAVAILNGGMATRFGGVVKGVVEVFDGKSFIALRVAEVARAPGAVPIFFMSSFATDADTRAHLEKQGWLGARDHLHLLTQHISVRLTPAGDVFRGDDGRASLYAPGHGDLFEVLAGADAFRRFVDGGGRMVMVSNVDNVAATLSPRVLGMHILGKRPVTVEVAPRAPDDKGGAPAKRAGRVEVLEGFRFPKDFDIARIPVFNTNTMIVDVTAVRADYPLTWFRADKIVDGRPAVQFERLMGEITSFCDATYLTVPRDGPEGRFMPIKTPADLEALRPELRARFA